MNTKGRRIILGRTNWRDTRRLFGLREQDRLHHMYIIGQTGTGKSSLLRNLMLQDLEADSGFALLDPHGDMVERLVAELSDSSRHDIIYLDAPDPSSSIGFNPLESVPVEQRPLAASGIVEAFRSVWSDWWGPRLEHFFRNALLTLLDQPDATLADLPRLFTEERFRRQAITRITHSAVRDFWLQEYETASVSSRNEALGPLRNKLGAFLSQPILYRILTVRRSSFDCRKVMDAGQILLVNLSKGRMGADACTLLGSLLVTRLGLAALSRADIAESRRRNFWLYLDEFHSFTTLSVAGMLSELRKYRLGLILAHQYLAQIAPEVREAVFGNVGTLLLFRVGPVDARFLGTYVAPELEDLDLMRLPNYHMYARLMVDGAPALPFSAETLPSIAQGGNADG